MSRTITDKAIDAFLEEQNRSPTGRYARKFGNTWIERKEVDGEDHAVLYLHGCAIAKYPVARGASALAITTAGWDTPTTLERLNGLPVRVHSRGTLWLNGRPWNGEWTKLASQTQAMQADCERSGGRLIFNGYSCHYGLKDASRFDSITLREHATVNKQPGARGYTDLRATGHSIEVALQPWADKPSGRIRLLTMPVTYRGRKTMRFETWEDFDRAIEWAIDATAEGLQLVARLHEKAQNQGKEAAP